MRIVKVFLITLIGMVFIWIGTKKVVEARPLDLVSSDPAWCDGDSDGFCFVPFGVDCDDLDPFTYPGADELADLKDNNCSGFEDEPPLGFDRQGYAMGGAASAVAWYGDYVYLAAAATLRVYYAPPGEDVQQVYQTELRDWAREMVVDGDTLFVAARGDGLYAFDLSQDPTHPELAGRVSGFLEVDGYSGVPSIFNGVDAQNNKVALARVNNVTKSQGGIDALVYDYDPISDTFTLLKVLGTEVRSKTDNEAPISVALTGDTNGLYIGYGILVGELVYVRLDTSSESALQADIGAPMDIVTQGDTVYAALTGLTWPWEEFSMLSRVTPVEGHLVEEPIVTHPGSGAGISVGLDGDLLCFGTWSPGRYEDGYNLWAFRSIDEGQPVRVGAAGTLDWIYQLTCRETGSGTGWIYVADEWGGLELWDSNGTALTLDLERHRVPSGTLSLDLWSDGDRIYSAKEGAGLWFFDDGDPQGARLAVEWIDPTDPGCSCDDCCPPQEGAWPYPPAVFVDNGLTNQGRIVVTAQNRDMAVPGDAYLMFFEVSGDDYELIYSDLVGVSDPIESVWGANMLTDYGEIIFTAMASGPTRLYQHCPADLDQVRYLTEIETPTQNTGLEFRDVAVYGDYLFLTELHRVPLAEPDSGLVQVYRWKSGELASCPAQPVLLDPPEYLGSFGVGMIPYKLLLDPDRQRLYVGCLSKKTFPVIEGDLLSYDLTAFDPADVEAMDTHNTSLAPDASMRVTYANVVGLLLDGDDLYVLDRDNGLYLYSLSRASYTGYYPAHRGPMSEGYLPREMVQSPEGVVPLYEPVALDLTPSGRVVVQENVTGRVSILSVQRQVYFPVIIR